MIFNQAAQWQQAWQFNLNINLNHSPTVCSDISSPRVLTPATNGQMCLFSNMPDNCVTPPLLSRLCVIITDKHKSGVDRNKNDPIFHFRLLRDTCTAVVLREEKKPLRDQTPSPASLPFLVFLFRLPPLMMRSGVWSGSSGALWWALQWSRSQPGKWAGWLQES